MLDMRPWPVFFSFSLLVSGAHGWSQPTPAASVVTARQLSGLSPEEATALIEKLADAQRRLKVGEFQPFELLVGSIASYDQTKVSPREAFLRVPFERVWNVQRVRSDNRLWQPYRLSYAPNGVGRTYWDIEVVLGINGNIERVQMLYKLPAPF